MTVTSSRSDNAGDVLETSEDHNVQINYETPEDYVQKKFHRRSKEHSTQHNKRNAQPQKLIRGDENYSGNKKRELHTKAATAQNEKCHTICVYNPHKTACAATS